MFLFRWIGKLFMGFLGLLTPMFSMAKGLGRPNSAIRWILHGVLVLLILALLGFLQYWFEIGRFVFAPHPLLRMFWLPLVGIMVYINIWLLWLVWRLYDPKPGPSLWEDIDFSWEQVTGAIYRAGMDPTKVPLFLVLGRPGSGFGTLFEAARIPLEIHGIPESQLAPLQVYAGKQAIFIVSSDTCLLGALCDRVTSHLTTLEGYPNLPPDAKSGLFSGPMGKTASPAMAGAASVSSPLAENPVDGAHEALRPITRDPELMGRMQSRLDHLCRLIRGMRHPWCPLNGVLLVIHELATINEQVATQAAILAQTDLNTVVESSGVDCQAVVLFSDAERILGFREFLALVPKDKRDQRLGKSIPLALNATEERRAEIMNQTIYWQSAELIPKLIFRTFQIHGLEENPDPNKPGGIDVHANRQLMRLIGSIWSRRYAMGRLCARILGEKPPRPLRVTGCYLGATGPTRSTQGFLTDLFAQIFEGQNLVTWTQEARQAEKALMLVVIVGYAFTALLTILTVVLAVIVFR